MPQIRNDSEVPDVSEDFHLLRIESITLDEGTKYGEPDVPETRVKMLLRVQTPGEEETSFFAWMSQNLGEKATLGSIYRAVTGEKPPRGEVELDDLVGKHFRHMITHNDNGWPKLVSGTAAASKIKSHAIPKDPPKGKAVLVGGGPDPDDGAEPPF